MINQLSGAGRVFAVILLSTAGCGRIYIDDFDRQSPACRDYVRCFEAAGGTRRLLDNTYGRGGTCWYETDAAATCDDECKTGLPALKAAYPDAGC